MRDGLGIKLLTGAGIEVGILSARTSPIVEKRSRELGLSEVLQGRENKLDSFRDFLSRRALDASEVAYLADDLLDLAVLGGCGLSAAPADAVPEVRSRVHYVTAARGGRGAVRELAERLLTARGDLGVDRGALRQTHPRRRRGRTIPERQEAIRRRRPCGQVC